MTSTALHKVGYITASAAIAAVPCRIWALLVTGGAGAGVVALANQASGSGTTVLNASAAIGGGEFIDLTALGGMAFTVACYATLSGTGVTLTYWYD